LLRFAKQHHSLQAAIAFIESHRCNASRHSNIDGLRIESRELPCCARDGRCARPGRQGRPFAALENPCLDTIRSSRFPSFHGRRHCASL